MKILITGATGYIGKNLIKKITNSKFEIFILTRNYNNIFKDSIKVNQFIGNIKNPPKKLFKNKFDVLIHLAWENLDDYSSKKHLSNLRYHKVFLKKIIENGIKKIIVAGSCAEYGKKVGELLENQIVNPRLNYAIAKNNLRKYIKKIIKNKKVTLNWIRIFYLYGYAEPPNTLIGQLKKSIKNKKIFFRMSSGEQTKDYIHLKYLIKLIYFLINQNLNYEIINCCSAKKTKVIKIVKKFIGKNKIKLVKNYYKDQDKLLFNSYGNNKIMQKILKKL